MSLQVPEFCPLIPALKFLGLVEYESIWQAMKQFTAARNSNTRDEIWLLQHTPVYTQGLAGKPEHLLRANGQGKCVAPDDETCHARSPHLNPLPQAGEEANESLREFHVNDIPVIKIDRGGQITYHGPGQIIAYLLLDLRRWKLNVRELVRLMEQAVINLLAQQGVEAHGRDDAPGVYVGDAKIASLGLKIKNGCCYHGIAFNVDMDLSPFNFINPCGYAGLRVTQARELGVKTPQPELEQQLAQKLIELLQQNLREKTRPEGGI